LRKLVCKLEFFRLPFSIISIFHQKNVRANFKSLVTIQPSTREGLEGSV